MLSKDEYDSLLLKGFKGEVLTKEESARLLRLSEIFGGTGAHTYEDIPDKIDRTEYKAPKEDEISDRYKIVSLINEDEHLTRTQKTQFLHQSKLFVAKFEDNLGKTSIRLAKDYPTFTVDEWVEYLRYPVVNRYLSKFKAELLSSQVERAFSEGKATASAMALKNDLDQESKMVNSNIVIIRMPEKEIEVMDNYV